jgi:hypothetical protein
MRVLTRQLTDTTAFTDETPVREGRVGSEKRR